MRATFKLAYYILLGSFSILVFVLFLIYVFSYRPAINYYQEIDKNVIGSTFRLAWMVGACKGMRSIPEEEKFKEPEYKRSIASDDEKLLQHQIALSTSITLAQPYLDRVTENKLNEFLKWSQELQYSITINNVCPQLNTSFDSLMEWSRKPMSLVPYSFKDYVIYYLKKDWLNTLS